MRHVGRSICAGLLLAGSAFVLQAQPAPTATPAVPRLVKFSGALTRGGASPSTGVVGVTFALYEEERGGTPLWMETQNIQADAAGHYTAVLGATRNEGIPAEVFASGQGRWLGVQPQGEAERPRVLLVSVPYALKAVDAETLGGLPPSAFALAGTTPAASGHTHSLAGAAPSGATAANSPDLTGTGTANHLAYWSNSTTIASSALFQTAAKRIGLGTGTPTTQLEVDSSTATAILGNATATSGSLNGVNGQTASPSGDGVSGVNTAASGGTGVSGASNATSGVANGVFGLGNSTSGNGVLGINNATSGFAVGVNGQTNSPAGTGVQGLNLATSGGNGVNGQSNATTGAANGVYGQSSSTSGNGVYGNALATSGGNNGVYGQTASPSGSGVTGVNNAATGGNGVVGSSNATSGPSTGVSGYSTSTGGTGVSGIVSASTGSTVGVQGVSLSSTGTGVLAQSPSTAITGVTEICNPTCTQTAGVAGLFSTAAGGTILNGYAGPTRVFYVDGGGNGFFAGNLNVTGKVTKGSGSFKIDHPLDPANQYLSHSFVESPDMMDVYNGIVRLDSRGEAWVNLPDYFEALNGDYRYQLTAIGAPAPRLYVAREVSQNHFKIAGGRPGGKVSWQVTGIRHDAYANAHRIPVTEQKPPTEQGRYLHPDVYGQRGGGEPVAGLQ